MVINIFIRGNWFYFGSFYTVFGLNYKSSWNKILVKDIRDGEKVILKNYILLYIKLEMIYIWVRIFFNVFLFRNIFRWLFEINIFYFIIIMSFFLKDCYKLNEVLYSKVFFVMFDNRRFSFFFKKYCKIIF